MVTEKDFNIIKALVEEEIGSLLEGDCFSSNITTDYLFSLSEIIEKLGVAVKVKRDIPLRTLS